MITLALDLAGKTTGWVLMSQGSLEPEQKTLQLLGRMWRGSPELIGYGSFEVSASRRIRENWAEYNLRRFTSFRDAVTSLMVYKPDRIVHEYPDRPRERWGPGDDGSAGREFNSMRGLARAEGWLNAVVYELRQFVDIEFGGVTVRQAKWEIAHNANASKEDVRRYMTLNHKVNVEKMTEDQSDAYAIGLADWLAVLGLCSLVPERASRQKATLPTSVGRTRTRKRVP